MGFDLFQSRASYNERCCWWSRNENDEFASDEFIMKRIPTGYFMAKEVSAEREQDITIGGSFMVGRTSVSIKTPDDIYGIKERDLVEYQGEHWIVDSVQKVKSRKQNNFFSNDKNCSHFWFLELRK